MPDDNRITTEQARDALYLMGEALSYLTCTDDAPDGCQCPSCEADGSQDVVEAFIAQFPQIYPAPEEEWR